MNIPGDCRDVHGDGIFVPSPPIPADSTPIPSRPRTFPSPQKVRSIPTCPLLIFFFCQSKAIITVTIVAILKIPHSATLTVNFKLWRNTNLFYEARQKLKACITDWKVSILVSALVIKSYYRKTSIRSWVPDTRRVPVRSQGSRPLVRIEAGSRIHAGSQLEAVGRSVALEPEWLNTAKDHKGALHRTTEDQQYHKGPTKDCKGTLRAKLQEIGTNWTQWCLIFQCAPRFFTCCWT